MRPEKSEVADPRFSKSTALALEKQAREREREEISSGRGPCCQGGRMAEPVEAPLSVVFSSIPGAQGITRASHSLGRPGSSGHVGGA